MTTSCDLFRNLKSFSANLNSYIKFKILYILHYCMKNFAAWNFQNISKMVKTNLIKKRHREIYYALKYIYIYIKKY